MWYIFEFYSIISVNSLKLSICVYLVLPAFFNLFLQPHHKVFHANIPHRSEEIDIKVLAWVKVSASGDVLQFLSWKQINLLEIYFLLNLVREIHGLK